MKLGIGNKVSFWEDIWYGPESMMELFPRLYSVSGDKNKVIHEMGVWVAKRWEWKFDWRRQFFAWEQELWVEFMEIILTACPMNVGEDK